jgi:putative phage-type endonuclease
VPVPPLARLILPWQPPAAGRAAWHAARARGIGASEALAVLGLNTWTTPYKLWLEKTGQLPPEPARGRMKWGIRLEPMVADWFTEETGIRVAVTGTWAHNEPLVEEATLPGLDRVSTGNAPVLALCNPDRFTEDGVGLEIKTVHPFSPDAKTWRHEVPDYPEAQAQWSMGVTGFPRWWVAAAVDGAAEPNIFQVPRNQSLINDLFAAAAEFIAEHVLPRVAPPPDDSPLTGKALNAAAAITGTTGEIELGAELAALVAERTLIKTVEQKALEGRLAAVENRIKHLLDGHRFGLVGGRPAVEYSLCKRPGYTVKAGEYMTLRTIKGGEDG